MYYMVVRYVVFDLFELQQEHIHFFLQFPAHLKGDCILKVSLKKKNVSNDQSQNGGSLIFAL